VLQQGDSFHVEFWWQAEGKPSKDYRMRFQFVDAKGKVVGTTAGSSPVPYYPTSFWQPGEYIKSQHEVQVPNDLPRGTYELQITLEDEMGLVAPAVRREDRPFPLSLFLGAQDEVGDAVRLRILTVEERSRCYTASPANPLQANIGGKVMLIGYDLAAKQVSLDSNIHVVLYWKALAPMDRSYTGFVHLLDETGRLAGQHDMVPQEGAYPTTLWREGEIVRDEYVIPVKPGTPEGGYLLVAGMYDTASKVRLPILDAKGAPVDDKAPLGHVQVGQ
jgi:hypothetical protein